MSKTKTKASKKIPRTEQWKINSMQRRKDIVAAGGRLLPVLLEKPYSDMLDSIITLRKKADPTISMTGWVRKMIESDLKLLQRRRNGKAGAHSSTP
jgi:hypothetical protein